MEIKDLAEIASWLISHWKCYIFVLESLDEIMAKQNQIKLDRQN